MKEGNNVVYFRQSARWHKNLIQQIFFVIFLDKRNKIISKTCHGL